MKIGIYDPYLDTLGGGERYCFEIASCLARVHDVCIFWDDPGILAQARKRFHTDTVKVRVSSNFWKTGNLIFKLRESRKYDALFMVSDGSIPSTLAKKTFLIFQFPVTPAGGLLENLKMQKISGILCYSQFVKNLLDKQIKNKAIILMPPVDLEAFKPGKKERLIVSVGRFTKRKNTKKQEFLIDVFKKLSEKNLKNWRLVLAGGMLSKDTDFVDSLNNRAKGFPVTIMPDATFSEIQSLYGKARIYWHAAGYGEDLEQYPQRAEHFGITTIEAMSAGAVPVVFAGGGQMEIVSNNDNGFLWESEDQLITKTLSLISDSKLWAKLSQSAQMRAKEYSRERFCQQLQSLI